MAKLILKLNGVVQGEFELNRESTTIGRRVGADIVIDNLAVSGNHAVITRVVDDCFVKDLGSTNGTSVNGKPIREMALRSGDVIGIGKHQLYFVADEQENALDEEELEKTVLIQPQSAVIAAAAAKVAEQGGGRPEKAGAGNTNIFGRLKVLNGPSAGKQMRLTKTLITLGRIGKQVAVISRRPQGYFLTHIESKGDGERYPIVNGSPIGPKSYPLRDHDKIELAGVQLEFIYSPPM